MRCRAKRTLTSRSYAQFRPDLHEHIKFIAKNWECQTSSVKTRFEAQETVAAAIDYVDRFFRSMHQHHLVTEICEELDGLFRKLYGSDAEHVPRIFDADSWNQDNSLVGHLLCATSLLLAAKLHETGWIVTLDRYMQTVQRFFVDTSFLSVQDNRRLRSIVRSIVVCMERYMLNVLHFRLLKPGSACECCKHFIETFREKQS